MDLVWFCPVIRPRPLIMVAVLGLLSLTAPVATAQTQRDQPAEAGAPATPATVYSTDRVIVQWAPGAGHGDKVDARTRAEVDFQSDLGNREFQLVEVEPGQSTADALSVLNANPLIEIAERDSLSAPNALPNDPLFGQLWGLRNLGTGIEAFPGAIAGDDIGAVAAWQRTVGVPSTVVADLDSGYRFEHPDLADVAWTNAAEAGGIPGVDDDANGIVDDVHGADFVGPSSEVTPVTDGDPTDDDLISGGHGVHTAGTIGAEGNNGVGITGVAQNIHIMPLRVCSRYPSLGESRCPTSSQIAAINYAGLKGARVANMSLGGTSSSQALVNAFAANPNVLFVISAGNDAEDNDSTPHYPCAYEPQSQASPPAPGAIDNIVCVAATDQADGLASFSDWGATSVDIGAPGTETLSTYPYMTAVEETFGAEDFGSKWPATGAGGGFERSDESPLASFGMTDKVGAPTANTVRETTSAPVTIPANGGCKLTQTRNVSLAAGDQYRYSVLLDGIEQSTSTPASSPGSGLETRFLELSSAFKAGGEVRIRFRFTAGSSPAADSGVWLDNITLVCSEAIGAAASYGYLQGTSMAAPHVTGAAGLLFSLKPSASVTEVRDALLAGVDAVPSLNGQTTSGGRLDVDKAMDSLEGGPVDNVAPAKPVLSGTVPGSGANDNNPKIKGSAEAGATVTLFKGPGCGGSPVATATAAQLAGPGIGVTVADNSITFFSARATDAARNQSICSAATSYLEDSPEGPEIVVDELPPGTFAEAIKKIEQASPPASPTPIPTPACTVPKLVGLTQAKATAALSQAHCKLGKVSKPKAKKGSRLPALAVKSSTPGAGAQPASGIVAVTLGPKPSPKKHHR